MPVEDQTEDANLHYKLGGIAPAELITPTLARLGPDSMDPCLV